MVFTGDTCYLTPGRGHNPQVENHCFRAAVPRAPSVSSPPQRPRAGHELAKLETDSVLTPSTNSGGLTSKLRTILLNQNATVIEGELCIALLSAQELFLPQSLWSCGICLQREKKNNESSCRCEES